MAPTSQEDDSTAQWWQAHPVSAAFCACFLALACVAATWWLGLLAEGPALVTGFLCVVVLIGFLHVWFQPQILFLKSLAALIVWIWRCFNKSCATPLGPASPLERRCDCAAFTHSRRIALFR